MGSFWVSLGGPLVAFGPPVGPFGCSLAPLWGLWVPFGLLWLSLSGFGRHFGLLGTYSVHSVIDMETLGGAPGDNLGKIS